MFANAAAFLSITKKGAMNSMPLRAEVDKFIETYLKSENYWNLIIKKNLSLILI